MPENAVHSVLLFVLLLQAKHFICDGPLQTKDMVHDKGIYGQPLGFCTPVCMARVPSWCPLPSDSMSVRPLPLAPWTR